MQIQPKTPLDLLREQLESCINDLILYSKHEHESLVIDANIQHKREQVAELRRKIEEMEKEEAQSE